MAIRGIFDEYSDKDEFITSDIEHPAVIETANYLEKNGKKVTYIPVDSAGFIDLEALKDAISSRTVLISIMHANNEIGTIQPVREISQIARKAGVLMHTDAVQSFGKIPVNVDDLDVDLLSIAAHKLYGPKGVGALYIRKGTRIQPLIFGGHQEQKLRSGTENTAGIIGFGEAVRIIEERGESDRQRIAVLADRLKLGIEDKIPKVKFNGPEDGRIKSTLNFSFPGLEAEAILLSLATKNICVSTGSACSEDSEEVSRVLTAIGLRPEIVRSSIRLSLGRFNTDEDVETVLQELPEIIQKLQEISSFNYDFD